MPWRMEAVAMSMELSTAAAEVSTASQAASTDHEEQATKDNTSPAGSMRAGAMPDSTKTDEQLQAERRKARHSEGSGDEHNRETRDRPQPMRHTSGGLEHDRDCELSGHHRELDKMTWPPTETQQAGFGRARHARPTATMPTRHQSVADLECHHAIHAQRQPATGTATGLESRDTRRHAADRDTANGTWEGRRPAETRRRTDERRRGGKKAAAMAKWR